jgi:hypothetical protein
MGVRAAGVSEWQYERICESTHGRMRYEQPR